MIIILIIFLYSIQITHTDDLPSTGIRLVKINSYKFFSFKNETYSTISYLIYPTLFCMFIGRTVLPSSEYIIQQYPTLFCMFILSCSIDNDVLSQPV